MGKKILFVHTPYSFYGKPTTYNVAREECALQCPKCRDVHGPLPPCGNCGVTKYKYSLSTTGEAGLFCTGCGFGFTAWSCDKCGTPATVGTTFGLMRIVGSDRGASRSHGATDASTTISVLDNSTPTRFKVWLDRVADHLNKSPQRALYQLFVSAAWTLFCIVLATRADGFGSALVLYPLGLGFIHVFTS